MTSGGTASFCYALMCHTDPDGVLDRVRRIRELSSGHVLVRYSDPAFIDEQRLSELGAHRLLSSLPTRWGDSSLIDAALEMFEVAREMTDCDYVVLLSGQDQPIRDLAAWEEQVRSWNVDAVLDPAVDQPEDHTWRWHVTYPPRVRIGPVDDVLRRVPLRLARHVPGVAVLGRRGERRLLIGRPRRRLAPPLLPVKCSFWAVLGRRAIDAVATRSRLDAEVRRWRETVRIPDEWYVSSILLDDPSLRIALARTTTKTFSPQLSRPEFIDLDILADMRRRSYAPFARKMPADPDPAVLAVADALTRRTPEEVAGDVVVRRETPAWASRVRAQIVETGVQR
ncbi:MAG: beta-1,6-N-acetylglucosaminyltransferase [Mobilicoccus sp.]|nr:beta-1,6-N-acetylglucosaminyltransferase [Mobilicoccus sp.]